MSASGPQRRYCATNARLQEYLLSLGPETLIIVPQSRLAHQVWRRQRLAARHAGKAAWEPLCLWTLSEWWRRLAQQLWLARPVAPLLLRLACWRQALAAVPFPGELPPDLSWAAALDDMHSLLHRYRLPPPDPEWNDPVIKWREEVRRVYGALLQDAGWLDPTALPTLLQEALAAGGLSLPPRICVVGLETPAAVEEDWLAAVAARRPVELVEVFGGAAPDLTAVCLPDRQQEAAWVLTQALEAAQARKLPLARVAITAPKIEDYLPLLQGCCQELFGQAEGPEGGFYNLSLGPLLAEAPLFQAAVLPLRFLARGQRRQELTSWLLSPFYGAFRNHIATFCRWDRLWREQGLVGDLQELAAAVKQAKLPDSDREINQVLVTALESLPRGQAPASLWLAGLRALWQQLEFPRGCSPEELEHWQKVNDLLTDLDQALGNSELSAGELLDWLEFGAQEVDLPSAGSSEVGLQVQGLLEMRGLEFDVVFCLGLNQGALPAPPRLLPLLTLAERRQVLGGDYASQQQFAAISYRYLLAAAPQVIVTRPAQVEEELHNPSYLVTCPWQEQDFPILSRPHPLWLRSEPIRAVWQPPPPPPALASFGVVYTPPVELSISEVSQALACPCQFLLGTVLALASLPEPTAGLAPTERGNLLHKILEIYTRRLAQELATRQAWDDQLAWTVLQEVLADHRDLFRQDLHWEAEIARWLDEEVGLLPAWLAIERERFQAGWRWLAMEASFCLQVAGIPFRLRGRLDRLDWHPQEGLLVWDYKTGSLPNAAKLKEEARHLQLPGGILAVQQGLIPLPDAVQGATVRAGLIGLKSKRRDHLKFEDFGLSSVDWDKILAHRLQHLTLLAVRLQQGDFSPDPQPPPQGKKPGACEYCPYPLICNNAFNPEEPRD